MVEPSARLRAPTRVYPLLLVVNRRTSRAAFREDPVSGGRMSEEVN